MIDDPITRKIIGCAIAVHSTLGTGFQEVIYQRALAIEMKKQQVPYAREQDMTIHYDGYDIGTRRFDFLVADKIMVEIKAVVKLDDIHLAQAINYLTVFNLDIGLLLNFGAQRLEFKRLFKRESGLKRG